MYTKRSLFYLIFLLTVTLIFLMLFIKNWRAATSIRDFQEIKKDKILNVVTEYNSIDFYVDGDTVTGFQYELCRYITQRSGIPVQIYLENNLGIAVRKLRNNVYDVIAQNIAITNEYKQFLAFTVPITQSRQVLVQRKRNEANSESFVANQLDLANKTVFVTKNSPAVMRLKHLSEEIAEPIIIKEITDYTSEQLLYMVAKNEIDYTVVDREISLKNAEIFPDLDFNTDISFTQLQAWALRKNSPVLLDSLNAWITTFKEEKIPKKS